MSRLKSHGRKPHNGANSQSKVRKCPRVIISLDAKASANPCPALMSISMSPNLVLVESLTIELHIL